MPKKIDYEELEKEGISEDTHLNGERDESKLVDIDINSKYHFRIKNPVAKFFASIFYGIVALCTPFIVFVCHGARFKGRRNLKELKNTGVVAISNHVLPLDCMILAQSVFPKKLYFQVLESSMKLPFIRLPMKACGCMPIPKKQSAKRVYIKEIDEILNEKKCVGIYPEASMWPYYEKIRSFKPGAFHFAVKNNVPIVPIVINFRKQRGLMKLLKVKAKFVTVHIGKPIYPNQNLPFNESVNELLEKSHTTMLRMHHWFKVIDEGKAKELEEKDNEII